MITESNGQLRAFIERIERLEDDKQDILQDIKEVFGEAKAVGFDPKIMRKILGLRRMDKDERQKMEALIKSYLESLGDLADTPLGQSAIDRFRDA